MLQSTASRFAFTLLMSVLMFHSSMALAQGLLPIAITDQRLDRYLQYMMLSDEQIAQIRRLHAEYLAGREQECGTDLAVHIAIRNAVYVRPEDFDGESMEDAYRELMKSQERLRFRLQAVNDSFFDEVELLLAGDQLPRMQRVRLAHDRATFRRSQRIPRERHLDIVEIVESTPFTDEDRSRAESVLMDIEPVFVHALRDAAEAEQRSGVFEFALLDHVRRTNSMPDEHTRAAMDELRDKGVGVRLRSSRRLVEVNRKGLTLLKAALSPEAAAELQRRYDEAAYPEIFPDPGFAGEFFEQALALEDLDEFQSAGLAAMHEQYRREHELLSRQLAKLIYEHSYLYVKHDEQTMAKLAARAPAVAALALKRESLNLEQPVKVRASLLPEQNERLKPWRYEKQRPPRPWARLANMEPDPKPPAARPQDS